MDNNAGPTTISALTGAAPTSVYTLYRVEDATTLLSAYPCGAGTIYMFNGDTARYLETLLGALVGEGACANVVSNGADHCEANCLVSGAHVNVATHAVLHAIFNGGVLPEHSPHEWIALQRILAVKRALDALYTIKRAVST
jgi:hypothetical protein